MLGSPRDLRPIGCYRNGHAGHADGLEQYRTRFGEHRVPIVNEIARVAQKSVHRIEQIAGNPFHPLHVRGDPDAGDLHGAGLQPHDEKHHVADGPENAQDFDAEEIACLQRLPMALEKARPGPFPVAFRRRLDASLRQDARDGGTADLSLQPSLRVADFGVAPSRVVARDAEDELADVARLVRPADLASLRAVVFISGQLAKPGEDRLGAHDLAADSAFLGSQLLAFERQAAPLLGGKSDPALPGRRRKSLLEDPNLLVQVVDPPRHPLMDRVRDHRDDELERRREHWSAPRLPADRCTFKSAIDPEIIR